jgi:hypothetical protein
MPDWLIWFIAFWAIVGCGTGCRRMWHHRRLRAGPDTGTAGELGSGGSVMSAAASTGSPSTPAGAEAAAASPPPDSADSGLHGDDTALGVLQRRFVEGKISLEQYEAELDRLDRKELG